MTLEEINKLDIVDYLASIGIQPQKISGRNFWYLSPFPDRNERTPSFKVNRQLNRWWDFGTGEGSTLIDFGIRYYNCTIRELTEKFSGGITTTENVPQKQAAREAEAEQKIQILETYPLRSFYLERYLWERRIPLDVARQYCVEAQYTFGPKPYYAIGFKTDAGGYELRNKFHKYSSSPKSPTLISHGAKDIAVFEGFFDMLTFVSHINTTAKDLPDLLVLNSTSFFESHIPIMDSYRHKHLFLDNDATGDKYTGMVVGKAGYTDHRDLYGGHTDLNQWATHFGMAILPGLDKSTHRGP
jgi:hypothetical protein